MSDSILDVEYFIDNINPDLLCPICSNVILNSSSCRDGHSFCKECILPWLKQKRECPIDRKELTEILLCNNRFMQDAINNLKVRCLFYSFVSENKPATNHGCVWVGKLEDRSKHF